MNEDARFDQDPQRPEGEVSGRSARPDPTRLTGEQIGRYLIGRRLGSGGAATVYQAYDQVQGRSVALKVLLPGADSVSRSRFRQEAHMAGALRHPNIVATIQVGDAPSDGIAYIAMDLVEGESLSSLLEGRVRLRPEESCNLLEPIARALAYAHSAGVIHRDVKPSNILLRPARSGTPNSVQMEALDYPVVPLLTDFGIARALDMPELTHVGRTIGTPAYMSPEQCSGSRQVSGRSDIYSLGAVLYRCLVGRAPFSGSTTQVLHAHVYQALTVPDDVLATLPPLVIAVLRRSLAKEPGDRYESAEEMAQDLALAAGRSGAATSESTATLTLASLPPVTPEPTRPTETVLVPSPTASLEVAAAPSRPFIERQPDRSRLATSESRDEGSDSWLFRGAGALLLVLVVALFAVAAATLPFERLFPSPTAVVLLDESPPVDNGDEEPERPATPDPDQSGVALLPTETPTAAVIETVETPTVVPDLEPTATPTAVATTPAPPPPSPTATPTATPIPATPTPSPTATATVEPTPSPTPTEELVIVACDQTPEVNFAKYLLDNPAIADELGCPNSVPINLTYEIQPFQSGYMIGRDDEQLIYVRFANGSWERRSHTWNPNMPEEPQFEEEPPGPGLALPLRGIGQVWASNLQLRQALGWATAPSQPASGVLQSFERGLLLSNDQTGDIEPFLGSNFRF